MAEQLASSVPIPDRDWVEVLVGVPNLGVVNPSSYYQLVGATYDHPNNHWGTSSAVLDVMTIAQLFYSQTALRIGINDMSLAVGGRFDLGPSYGGSWWNSPHSEHMWGENADIPFQYLGGYYSLFLQIADDYTTDILEEGNHYHLRF